MVNESPSRERHQEERYGVLRGPQGRWWVLRPGSTFEIGRDPACPIAVPSRLISRHHALLRWRAGSARPELRDAGSANGTMVDGRAARSAEFTPLESGATVHLGDPEALLTLELHACGQLAAPGSGRLGQDCSALELLRLLERDAFSGRLALDCPDGQVVLAWLRGEVKSSRGWGGDGERVLDRLLQVDEGSFQLDPRQVPADTPLALCFSRYLSRRVPVVARGGNDRPPAGTERLRPIHAR